MHATGMARPAAQPARRMCRGPQDDEADDEADDVPAVAGSHSGATALPYAVTHGTGNMPSRAPDRRTFVCDGHDGREVRRARGSLCPVIIYSTYLPLLDRPDL